MRSINIGKDLDIKGTSQDETVSSGAHRDHRQLERKLIGQMSNPTMNQLFKYACNQIKEDTSNIVESPKIQRRKNPTTTIRPYHGQIPRPSVLSYDTNML